MTRIRLLLPLLLVSALTACGDDGTATKPAPGTPENPLVAAPSEPARPNEGAAPSKPRSQPESTKAGRKASWESRETARPSTPDTTRPPGYGALVENQSSRPKSRFTPCSLVTEGEARAIVGAPLQAPLEAPLGPTCIYRTRSGKGMVALAVQTTRFSEIKRRIRAPRTVAVSGREAYCGKLGQPMLYVPLAGGRVLSVTAQCNVAARFAVKALPRL